MVSHALVLADECTGTYAFTVSASCIPNSIGLACCHGCNKVSITIAHLLSCIRSNMYIIKMLMPLFTFQAYEFIIFTSIIFDNIKLYMRWAI